MITATQAPAPKALPPLMTSGAVADLLSVSVRTLWRLVAAGQVPQPVRYNRKLVRWKRAELEAYVANLGEGRP